MLQQNTTQYTQCFIAIFLYSRSVVAIPITVAVMLPAAQLHYNTFLYKVLCRFVPHSAKIMVVQQVSCPNSVQWKELPLDGKDATAI